MTESQDYHRLGAVGLTSLLVSVAGGAGMAYCGRAVAVQSGALVLISAALSGAAVLAWRPEVRRVHVSIAFLAGVLAAGAFFFVGPGDAWQAEQLPDDDLDVLVLESIALRMCFHRGVPNVQDYGDVPEAIRVEARQKVAAMSRRERRALIDERFGRVINADLAAEDEGMTMAGWALAAGALAATPLGIWSLLRRGE